MRRDELPGRLVILGAGYIAAEFAHVMDAFGVDVTLVHRGDRLLRRADSEVSRRFGEAMERRIDVRLHETLVRLEPGANGGVVVHTTDATGAPHAHTCDLVLNATGRVPNSDTLDLDAAGVKIGRDGLVWVDEQQRTSQPHIWALGDVASSWMLKHVANHEMRVVQHNLLHELTGAGDDYRSADHRFVPSAIFSDPQVGQVGLTEEQVRAEGRPYLVHVQEYGSVAYGWALEDSTSFVKLLADADTRQLVGAHVVGPQASTLVQQCIQAMHVGTDIDTMAHGQYWIHPALPEVIENCLIALAGSRPVVPEGARA